MDNSYCCVPQCNSLGSDRPRTSFHRFPRVKDESSRRRREKWVLVLRIGKQVSDRMVVCGKHFQPSDFFRRGNGPLARTKLKENVIPSLNLPLSLSENRDKLNKQKEDSLMRLRRKEKRERLSTKKNVKKRLETIPKGKNVPLASNSSGSKFITIRPTEELNKVADASSISGGIEVKRNLYIPTVLKTSTTKPHSNQTKQNHSNLTETDSLSDFKENTDSDITTDTDDEVVNNSENESELSEESSKCQLNKLKTQYKELQTQLKKCQKQCKLLTKDNDKLQIANASHRKDIFSLMKDNACLKEVINSLRQIISVSDEKYFETIS